MNTADRIEAAYDRAVLAARKRSALFDHGWQAKERFEDVQGGRLAAAISYYGFFAAFALVVVGYSILGRALGADADALAGSSQGGLIGTINTYLSNTLPWVLDTAQQVGRGEVTVFGLVALVLSGVGWVEELRSAQRAVWLLDQHPGTWINRRLLDLAMLVGLGLLLIISLATTVLFDSVLHFLAPDTNFGNLLVRSSGPVFEFAVNLVLATAILVGLPRLRLSWRRLAPAVLLVGIGIQLLNTVGKWFIARSEQRPAYQLVAGAVGLLIYLYLLNQLILLGAALAATSTRGTVVDLAGGPVASPAAPVVGPVASPAAPVVGPAAPAAGPAASPDAPVAGPGGGGAEVTDGESVGEARTRGPGKPR